MHRCLPHLKKAAAKFNVTILARKTKIEGKADGLIKKGAWTQAQKVEFFNGVRAGEEFKAFELETTGMQAEWTTALRTFERTYKTDATQACEAGDKVRKLDKKLKSTQMEQFGLYEKSLKPLLKKVKKGSASLVQADGSR